MQLTRKKTNRVSRSTSGVPFRSIYLFIVINAIIQNHSNHFFKTISTFQLSIHVLINNWKTYQFQISEPLVRHSSKRTNSSRRYSRYSFLLAQETRVNLVSLSSNPDPPKSFTIFTCLPCWLLFRVVFFSFIHGYSGTLTDGSATP